MIINNQDHFQFLPFEKGWSDYFDYNLEKLTNRFTSEKSVFFINKGKEMSLSLFHQMFVRVPAYKDFLQKNKIDPDKIKSVDDIGRIPLIDKENYLKQYSLSDLCWDGEINSPIISASSGVSGTPTFWPRSTNIEIETSYIYELFLKNIFKIDKRRTLLINGFSMGIYVGGSFTLNCSMRLFQKGYPLTIVTPGINQKEIVQILQQLPKHFEQVIIGGYPPFVRDVLEECEAKNISLQDKNIKLFFASESLSEDFRSHLYSKIGVEQNDYLHSSMNLYGTADAAIAGHEMPLGTLVRTLFNDNPDRCLDYFGTSYVPSINQYYPFFKDFEIREGEVVFSSYNNAVPLMCYNIHDRGKILMFEEMIEIVKSFGISEKEIEKLVGKDMLWRLPYIALYGRSDLSVTIYGLNIYPEHIKTALEQDSIKEIVTGRFVMETKNRKDDHSQYLFINVELNDGVEISEELNKKLQDTIKETLKRVNVEFRHLSKSIKEKSDPIINLCKRGDKQYFPISTKHKWVQKNNSL
jgi:phenylacetate-CoA ligase